MANSLLSLLMLKIIIKHTLQPGVWDKEWKSCSSKVGKDLFEVHPSIQEGSLEEASHQEVTWVQEHEKQGFQRLASLDVLRQEHTESEELGTWTSGLQAGGGGGRVGMISPGRGGGAQRLSSQKLCKRGLVGNPTGLQQA